MSTIELKGHLGPLDALELRRLLDKATAVVRPHVVVDLSAVESLHPAVAAALVSAARRTRQAAGNLRIVEPTTPGADRMFRLVSMPQLVR